MRSPLNPALIFTVLLLADPPSRFARAPAAAVIEISHPPGHPTEPSVAVNPRDPKQVVAVYQGGAQAQGSATAAFSTDAGRTFSIAQGTKAADWRVQGDVSITFDNHGHAFLCYLAFDRLGTSSYWAHNAGRNGIFVLRSPDGGKTWEKPAASVKAFPTGCERDIQFEDEPRIFADNSPASPYAGNVYVGWVEWQLEQSVMLFSRSVDDGKTWSTPIRVSTHPGLPRDDNGSLGGYVQASGPDGAIYAIWDDGNSIVMTQSSDAGKRFSPSRPVLQVGPPYFGDVVGVSRSDGFPQIAIDPHGGRPGGNLYITWSDYRNGDIDVFLSSSSDRGRTWSQPVRVNDNPVHDGTDQFFQWMTVDPETGVIYVQFYDRRADPENRKTLVTLARSTDSGRTFKNYAWTEKPFEGTRPFLGDYTWIAAYRNRVYGVWTETAAENQTSSAKPSANSSQSTIIRVGTADFSGAK